MSTIPGETAVVWMKPMSRQHASVLSDVFAHQSYLALPDVQYHSSGKKPVAIVFVFFRVCDVFLCVVFRKSVQFILVICLLQYPL